MRIVNTATGFVTFEIYSTYWKWEFAQGITLLPAASFILSEIRTSLVQEMQRVRIDGYGNIGEYIPFYFTPRSIMLYNIVTGYWAPVVPKLEREEILIIRSEIGILSRNPRFFFTDGQANAAYSNHYTDLRDLDQIDWESIQQSNFLKSDLDTDRPRRYQAEFLVHSHVPLKSIESFLVYNEHAEALVNAHLKSAGLNIAVTVAPICFFP